MVDEFAEYARVCFGAFGDHCANWITLNEPWCSAALGYCNGEHAPGRTQNPGTEPYLAAHHMLLAHAKAVQIYRREFKLKQGGVIGITLNMDWREPASDSPADIQAAQRSLDFNLGW